MADKQPDFLIAVDEARRLLRTKMATRPGEQHADPRSHLQDQIAEAQATFRTAGKALCFATQNVTDIPDDILKNIPTLITFRTTHQAERETITDHAALLPGQTEILRTLPPGHGFVSTPAEPYPQLVQFDLPDVTPKPRVKNAELAAALNLQPWFRRQEARRVKLELEQLGDVLQTLQDELASRLTRLGAVLGPTTRSAERLNADRIVARLLAERDHLRRWFEDRERYSCHPLLPSDANVAFEEPTLAELRSLLLEQLGGLRQRVASACERLSSAAGRYATMNITEDVDGAT